MEALDLARWQFGITTVYHFLFVPITIGLGPLVAIMQTMWVRTGDDRWLRATKFFGKLFLINFAMGVVTGIVQEFQFGMAWSDYSRFVGDVFGAPLAIEGLAAFFLESTLLGIWIFGWDRVPRGLHLAAIWSVAVGSALSAWFILAANSFMQHPTGYVVDPERGRAELTDIGAVLLQDTTMVALVHTLAASLLTGGAFVVGVGLWLMMRGRAADAMRKALGVGIAATLVGGVAVTLSGDWQAKVMFAQQPMKMAAAEALYETSQPAPFALVTVGTLDGSAPIWSLDIPGLLSFLATGDWGAEVHGINPLNAQYQQQFGPGDYRPSIPVAFWSFRLMIGIGLAAAAFALLVWWLVRRGRAPTSRWVLLAAGVVPLLPVLASSFGWIFTETGRQPWVVFGLMRTSAGVSPTMTPGHWTSLITFTLLYGVLAVIEVGLLLRAIKLGPEPTPATPAGDTADDRPLTFSY